MSSHTISRRGLLAGAGAIGAGLALSGCATTTSRAGSAQQGGAITLQSDLSSPLAEKAMQALVAAYNKQSKYTVNLNTVAATTYQPLLPTYLTSANPPDIYTWYAGHDAAHYASKGLLLDVGGAWSTMGNYQPALKALSTDATGKKIFVPTDYYWWGVFYRKSQFAKWGLSEPKTWSDFLNACATIKSKGVTPIGLGAGTGNAWVAAAWFDYFDIRLNGADFHRALLQGQHSFTDRRVVDVFTTWKQVLPYFDPNGTAVTWQEASNQLLQGQTAMLLTGTFFADAVPKGSIDDLDFFKFPVIDPSVPDAEEAPTDGLFASSKTHNAAAVLDFMTWMATPAAQNLWTATSSGTVIPANPQATAPSTPLVQKGKAMLDAADQLTQFFNRDSSDALQNTANTALINFIQNPGQLTSILSTWQSQAEQVWKTA
ncbi:carbohydrate ABC transporter substrate-binding protein [Streptacidiphilus pinicola]|uniref:Carbohydrate ABC transporter substrate-binding protein n=1 Tax=Streptacidiphilus pinicola TaxID=2219663 RepID=A0A2X0IUY9_9ACTN|nr:extracellular solute-binding protein [Streptacidiphilus pinicola]RAG87211.1 carbohydrate ABC transporter substrate-binding protein [Streptacidiphilus pinicola]